MTPEAGRASLKKAKEGMLAEVDKMLSDGRRFLLNTDRPTYIDVAFASLSAVLAMPDEYGGPVAVNEETRYFFATKKYNCYYLMYFFLD